jgi:hypothetical protein
VTANDQSTRTTFDDDPIIFFCDIEFPLVGCVEEEEEDEDVDKGRR